MWLNEIKYCMLSIVFVIKYTVIVKCNPPTHFSQGFDSINNALNSFGNKLTRVMDN